MKVDRKKYKPDVIDILNKKLEKNGHKEYSEKTLKNGSNAIFHTLDKVYGAFKTPLEIITSCPMDLLAFFESYTNPHTRISYCKAIRWYLGEHPNSDVYKTINEAYEQCMIDVDGVDTNCPTDRAKECNETIKELQELFLSKYNPKDNSALWPIAGYYVFVPCPRNDFYDIRCACDDDTEDDIIAFADDKNNVYDMKSNKIYYGDSKTLNFKRNRNGTVKCIPVELDMDKRYKDILDGWVKKTVSGKGKFHRAFPETHEDSATRYIKSVFGDKYNIQILRKKWATESVGSGSVYTMKTNAHAMLHHVGTHVGYYATEEKKEEKEN